MPFYAASKEDSGASGGANDPEDSWRSGVGGGRFTVDGGGGNCGEQQGHAASLGAPTSPGARSHLFLDGSFASSTTSNHPTGLSHYLAMSAPTGPSPLLSGPSSLPTNLGWAGPHGDFGASTSLFGAPPLPFMTPSMPSSPSHFGFLHSPFAHPQPLSSPSENPYASPLDLFRPPSGFHGLVNLPGTIPIAPPPAPPLPQQSLPSSRMGAAEYQAQPALLDPWRRSRTTSASRDPKSDVTASSAFASAPKRNRSGMFGFTPIDTNVAQPGAPFNQPRVRFSETGSSYAPSSGGGSPVSRPLSVIGSPTIPHMPTNPNEPPLFSPTEAMFGDFNSALTFPSASLASPGISGSSAQSIFGFQAQPVAAPSTGAPDEAGHLSEAALDQATAELESRDPLAAQVWKMYGDRKRRLPTDEAIEQLTWKMMGMGLGDLRKRMDEAKRSVLTPNANQVAKAPNGEAAGEERLFRSDKGKAKALDEDQSAMRDVSMERGRRGRSAGTRSNTGTPKEVDMDWSAKSRSRSRPPETTNTDWRMTSRSRSRPAFRLSMPSLPFNGDFTFSSLGSSTTHSPAAMSVENAEADASKTGAAGAGSGDSDELISQLLASLTRSSSPGASGVAALFDFGTLGLPTVPSRSSLLGSVPGLPLELAKLANAHAEYGSLPRLVRKTSYDEAMRQNSAAHRTGGTGNLSPGAFANPANGPLPSYPLTSDPSRKRSTAPSPARERQGASVPTSRVLTNPYTMSFREVPPLPKGTPTAFDFSFPSSLSPTGVGEPAAFVNVDLSRAPPYSAASGSRAKAAPASRSLPPPGQSSAAYGIGTTPGLVSMAEYAGLLMSHGNPSGAGAQTHVNLSQVHSGPASSADPSRSGSSAGVDTPSPTSAPGPVSFQQGPLDPLSGLRPSASAPNLPALGGATAERQAVPLPPAAGAAWSGATPSQSVAATAAQPNAGKQGTARKAPATAKKERERNVPLQNPDGTPIQCLNCKTQNTPLWRRDTEGKPLCNACGLFLNLHGIPRPVSLNTGVIKRRNRGKNSDSKAAKKGSASRPGSRRNSTGGAGPPAAVPAGGGGEAGNDGSGKRMRTLAED